MKSSEQVIRALGRFDWATTREIADSARTNMRTTWFALGRLVSMGLVERNGDQYRLRKQPAVGAQP